MDVVRFLKNRQGETVVEGSDKTPSEIRHDEGRSILFPVDQPLDLSADLSASEIPSEPTPPTSEAEQGEGSAVQDERLLLLELDAVLPNPRQPRRHFDPDGLEELASSIREVGVLQPVLVRETPEGYELVAGERRLRASRMAGRSTIPARVVEVTPQDQHVLALVENLQRQDLSPVEEARSLAELLEQSGMTQVELARRIGRSQAAVANKLRLLKLASPVQKLIEEGKLGERQARALVGLDEEDQIRLAGEAVNEGVTAREMERRKRTLGTASFASPDRPSFSGHVEDGEIEEECPPATAEQVSLPGEPASTGPGGEVSRQLGEIVEYQKKKGVAVTWKVHELDQRSLVVELRMRFVPSRAE
jgi:ParB family chromosome partitioning protein